jgi:hypothetical protein
MGFSTTAELVWGAIIASMVILRVVWIANGRGIGWSLMEWSRWERAAYLSAMAGVIVPYAVENPGILTWMIGVLFVIIAIGFALKPPKAGSKSVNSPAPNPDAPTD